MFADRIVINKMDLISKSHLNKVENKIRSINKAEVDFVIQKFLDKTNFVTVSVDPN